MLREILLTLLGVLMLALPIVVPGTVYRWLGDNGEVVYSQRRPIGFEFQEVSSQSSSIDGHTDDPVTESSAVKNGTETVENEQLTQPEALFRKNCQVARRNLTLLEASPTVIDVDADGNEQILDADQRAAKSEQARAEIETYCQ